MHNSYMIVISALFAVVFAIMIYSLIKHRKTCGSSAAQFTGPTGTVQWLWALVPLAILAGIDFALFDIPEDRTLAAPNKIELAAAQDLSPALPALADNTSATDAERVADKSGSTTRHQTPR